MDSSFDRSRRNVFAQAPINRATERREQQDFLADLHQRGLELLLSEDLHIAIHGEQLHLSSCDLQPEFFAQRWYLGSQGDAHFFVRTVQRTALPEPHWADLRMIGHKLSPEQAGLAAYARGLQFWHQRHGFCGVCGHPTVPEQAGHRRRCSNPNCGAEHFPRTDPAIIVAVQHEGAILLGRQASWPPARYSTLAGFVEPGESLEDAVLREVYEEAGVSIQSCDYYSSQPWPFPASLMLGFTAHAVDRTLQIGAELQDARWFDFAEFEDAIAAGELKLPPPVSVSFKLIEHWYQSHVQNPSQQRLTDFIKRQT